MKNIFLPIALLLAVISCKNGKIEDAKAEEKISVTTLTLSEEQLKNVQLTTTTCKQQNIAEQLRVNGVIDVPPQNVISVSVPLGGYLKFTQLLPGMPVQKGEVIATLEDKQYIDMQQDYLVAKTKLTLLEFEFNRQKELNTNKSASDKVLQQAEADFINQKIAVKALSEKLKLIGLVPEKLNENELSRTINFYAPISGYVSKINANIGKYVNPSDVLFELVNTSDIHLALTIFEKDIDKIFIGQNLVAYNNHAPEKKYPCKILLISRDLSAERSVLVHCHFDNYDEKLIPGMFMNADIEIKKSLSTVVSEEAILNFENKNYVFVQNSKLSFELVEIQTGRSENGMIEIIADNSITDKKIVLNGAYTLLMKLKNTEEE